MCKKTRSVLTTVRIGTCAQRSQCVHARERGRAQVCEHQHTDMRRLKILKMERHGALCPVKEAVEFGACVFSFVLLYGVISCCIHANP